MSKEIYTEGDPPLVIRRPLKEADYLEITSQHASNLHRREYGTITGREKLQALRDLINEILEA